MKVVLDSCVLYPTVMREMILGAAKIIGWTPLWSERILEEWARAARKAGQTGKLQARAEIALIKSRWPEAEIDTLPDLEKRLWLPDRNDRHVLATAISGKADVIVTLNSSDFPSYILREEGLERLHPDALLMQNFWNYSVEMTILAQNLTEKACRLTGRHWDTRRLLRKARLPRLAKAIINSL